MIIDSIENKGKILEKFLELCIIYGWNDKALKEAISVSGLDPKLSELIFENGAEEIADFFISIGDEKMLQKAQDLELEKMRIRERIKELVKIRLSLNSQNKMAVKKLINFYLSIKQLPKALKHCYKTSDLIWYRIGDQSTDFNFYTKRLILSKIYIRTLLYFINDDSEDNVKSWDFLDRQIEKVMKFEKIKSQIKNCAQSTKNFSEKIINFKKDCSKTSLKNFIKKLPFFRLTKND